MNLISLLSKKVLIITVTGIIVIGSSLFFVFNDQDDPKESLINAVNTNIETKLNNNINSNANVGNNINEDTNTNEIVEDVVVQEETKEEVVDTANTEVITTSNYEVNSLFQTYYNRDATQDELNWWTTKTSSELETSLSENTQPTPIVDTEPAVTVDPLIAIEQCKVSAQQAKSDFDIEVAIVINQLLDNWIVDNGANETFTDLQEKFGDKESSDYIENPQVRNQIIENFLNEQKRIISVMTSKFASEAEQQSTEAYNQAYSDCINNL